ncbi:hypothetical protein XELAEV_18044919mg [Xenopus laevis]|uniref:Uncharacterized protein n=1 Tax=Xenopus laevis TaxID=8355 RepID=A0A974C000_XENLA|nr:hypothetical protein XELAEV_18044919mg [Xenopus laevis]
MIIEILAQLHKNCYVFKTAQENTILTIYLLFGSDLATQNIYLLHCVQYLYVILARFMNIHTLKEHTSLAFTALKTTKLSFFCCCTGSYRPARVPKGLLVNQNHSDPQTRTIPRNPFLFPQQANIKSI